MVAANAAKAVSAHRGAPTLLDDSIPLVPDSLAEVPVARPTSIRIFLTDGTPDGIRIVEKSNWTGRAVVGSRSQLADALARDELNRPGVYVLAGTDDDGENRLYVGEADVLGDRLRSHANRKDFWTWFVAFTSADENLNKAHVRYLEARLLVLAKTANQWVLENTAAPNQPPLSEADRADADWFLDEMLLIYPILGIDAFEAAASDPAPATSVGELVMDGRGVDARGRETKDGFVVLAGSRARKAETAAAKPRLIDRRQQLLARGVLTDDGTHYVFTQDYRFSSPSTAASVLAGGSSNGRKAWKTPDGARTLKQLQDARASADLGSG